MQIKWYLIIILFQNILQSADSIIRSKAPVVSHDTYDARIYPMLSYMEDYNPVLRYRWKNGKIPHDIVLFVCSTKVHLGYFIFRAEPRIWFLKQCILGDFRTFCCIFQGQMTCSNFLSKIRECTLPPMIY